MSILSLAYVFCLVLGGVFVTLSVFGGLVDSDADVDADVDADLDVDLDADADFAASPDADGVGGHSGDIEVAVARRFNPFVSFKFYTFALTFFGLTGVIFSTFGLWESALGVFGLSSVTGLSAGMAMAYALFWLNQTGDSDAITERDYVGLNARVMLPVGGEKVGKVRLQIKGRTIEMPAKAADDDVVFDFNEECFVLGIEDGVVEVVQTPRELATAQATAARR